MNNIFKILTISTTLIVSTGAWAQFTMPTPKVSTVTTQYSTWEPHVVANGTLQAVHGIVVKTEIPGRVRKILFNSGDSVKAGTPLLELNNDMMKADLDLNTANLTLSQVDYERKKALYPKHAIAKSELDAALANLKVNQARVAASKAQFAQSVIVAPFSGKLGLRQVSIGDQVTPATPIVNLQAIDPINIDFTIPESDILKVAVGRQVIVEDDAYPDTKFVGTVKAIESVINTNAQSLTVRAEIPNSKGILLPGTFMRVTLSTGQPEQVISIPQTAVMHSVDGNYVYRVLNKKVSKTKVKTGLQHGQQINITEGLKPGEQVVTAGQMKLNDGAAVEILNK
ncbi:MAG: efflux RND transporter periplasmic adaptor subunit [Gammaproteobacteria bacterium]|nr:efflux RND transporter periplasmic adaptor subunit [Gammaproteobacteria bacterium]